MNVIKKYWDSVYLYILPLLPATCMVAGIFWTTFKFLGSYPNTPWIYFLLFDCSHLVYLLTAFYIIYRCKRETDFLTNHLLQIKCYIMVILSIQYIAILLLFPSPHIWECTIIFLLISMFYFDTKLQIINSAFCFFFLLFSYLTRPDQFLPTKTPHFLETISFQVVVYLISTLLLITIAHLVKHFLIQEQEEQLENTSLLEKQLDYYTQTDLMDRELRKFRHDIKNHFFALEELLRQDNTEELMEYFNDLQESFFSQEHNLYFSGNPVTDAILNHELHHRCSNRVQVSVSGSLSELDTISSMDICTIFSNMLTNAINAANECKRTPAPRLEIQFMQGNQYFSITIRNDTDQSRLDSRPQKLSVCRNHGYGLKKIKEVTEKYHGIFQMEQENNQVTSTVFLPL